MARLMFPRTSPRLAQFLNKDDAASPDECDELTAFYAKGPMDQTTAV